MHVKLGTNEWSLVPFPLIFLLYPNVYSGIYPGISRTYPRIPSVYSGMYPGIPKVLLRYVPGYPQSINSVRVLNKPTCSPIFVSRNKTVTLIMEQGQRSAWPRCLPMYFTAW